MKYPRVKLDSIKADVPYAFVGGPFGSNLTTRDYVEEGVPIIRGNNQSSVSSFHDDDFVFVSEEKAVQLTPNLASPGDVIFTQRGTLGQVGVIPKNAKFDRYVISQSQMKLTVHPEKADAMYVYYYFRRPDIVQTIISLSQSSGVPHINLGTLKNFEIPLPPIDAQQRIVSILSTYDDLIENNRRRIDLLEQSARLLYKEWFVSLCFPGHEHVQVKDGVPEGWKCGKVEDLGKIITGKTPSTKVQENYGGDIPFVKTPDMHAQIIVTKTEQQLSERGANTQENKYLPNRAVMVSCIGTVGVVAIAGKRCQTNQQINSVVCHDPTLNYYAYHALLDLKPRLESMGGGATMPNVNKAKFSAMPIMIPDGKILALYDDAVVSNFAQIETLSLMNEKLSNARDLLLPRLMNDEIPV
jgi:type I restriction enzyme, S subunit